MVRPHCSYQVNTHVNRSGQEPTVMDDQVCLSSIQKHFSHWPSNKMTVLQVQSPKTRHREVQKEMDLWGGIWDTHRSVLIDPSVCSIEQSKHVSVLELNISTYKRLYFPEQVLQTCLALCRHYNVAVWHGHDPPSHLLGLLVRRFYPMKLVATVKQPVWWGGPSLQELTEHWCLPSFDFVACGSPSAYQWVGQLGVHHERCGVFQIGPIASPVSASAGQGFDPVDKTFRGLRGEDPRPIVGQPNQTEADQATWPSTPHPSRLISLLTMFAPLYQRLCQ